MKHFVT